MITRKDGTQAEVSRCCCRIDTPIEVDYYQHGGILPFVLRELVGGVSGVRRPARSAWGSSIANRRARPTSPTSGDCRAAEAEAA